MYDIKSLLDLDQEYYYNVFAQGIDGEDKDKFIDVLKDAIQNHYHIFDDDVFDKCINVENFNQIPNIRSYVVPSIKRIFYEFFLNPNRFLSDSDHLKNTDEKTREKVIESMNGRNEFFKLQFNLEEFLIFMAEGVKNNYTMFDNFNNIDRTQTLMELICDEYIGDKYNKSYNGPLDIQGLRDLRIKSIIK